MSRPHTHLSGFYWFAGGALWLSGAIGHASPAACMALIGVLGGFLWLVFEAPQLRGIAWFAERRSHTVGMTLIVALASVAGTVVGIDKRERAANDAVAEAQVRRNQEQRQQSQDAAEALRRASEAATMARQAAERDRAAFIEAHRSPQERGRRAAAMLAGAGTAEERYCAARSELDPVPNAWRPAPEVRRAFHLLQRAEREALRAQQEAAEEDRGLECRDGEMSPTCTCHGSHRGCCSWHGGVRGCEPQQEEVICPVR